MVKEKEDLIDYTKREEKLINSFIEFSESTSRTAEELVNILIEKNKGYGNAFYDGIEKVKEKIKTLSKQDFDAIKYAHYIGIWQRLNDKMLRFFNLIFTKENDEKKSDLYDAILDIAGYGLLSLNYLNNENKREEK